MIEIVLPGSLPTLLAITQAARAARRAGHRPPPPPNVLHVHVFSDCAGLPYPTAHPDLPLSVIGGLSNGGLLYAAHAVTHIDFRTTPTLTEPRTIIRLRTYEVSP